MKRFFLIVLSLLLFIIPVLGAETVTRDNYAEPIIKVNNESYILNETVLIFNENKFVWIDYLIEPKTDEDAKKIDDRNYDISTELNNAKLEYRIIFKNGASISKSDFTIDVPDADELDGVDRIEINLTGYTPSIDERLKEIFALRIRIQDGGYILPDVKMYIIDLNMFSNDIDKAKDKLNELNDFLVNYTGKADVSTLKDYLDCAKENITLAEDNFENEDYIYAEEKLKNAEFWLEKAEEEKIGVEARYLYSEADRNIKDLGNILSKIEAYLEEIEEKNLMNTSTLIDYKTNYSGLENRFDSLTSDLAIAKGYLDIGSYEDAKSKLEKVLRDISDVRDDAERLLNELSSYLEVTPTTQQSSWIKLPEMDWDVLGFYAGIAGGVLVALALITIGVRRYLRRRKWDELK